MMTRSLFLLLSLLSSLPLLHACTESASTPYPLAGRPLATSARSKYVLAAGRERAGVRIYDASHSIATPAATVQRTCSPGINGAPYSPNFGKSSAVASDTLAAIGAPNRLDGAAAYSTIDIFNPTLATSGAYTSSIVTTLYSQTINDLGTLLAMDAAGTYLASYYDATQIAVFSPLIARAGGSQQFEDLGTQDAAAILPTGFSVDNFAVQFGVLVVSGVAVDLASSNCVPQILVYQFTNPGVPAWTLLGTQSLLRDTTKPDSANVNAIPCTAEPSSALPIDLSYDAKQALIGSPSQGCVYSVSITLTSPISITYTPRCADATMHGANFGASVAFTDKEAGSAFTVSSSSTTTLFSTSNWVSSTANPFDSTSASFYQFPNRLQPGANTTCTAPGATATSITRRQILSVVSNPNMTLVLYAPLAYPTSTDLLALRPQSAVAAGYQWNPLFSKLELCPAGRYSNSSGSTYAGCNLCAAGSYQSQAGQSSCIACSSTQYCPAGSVSSGYASTLFTPSTAFSSSLPWFDFESYREAFEELLIGTIFSISLYPALILFFVLTGVCLVIYICSLWAPADGDDRECCSSPGTCCLHTYRLLGRWRFFSRGRTGPWPYTSRAKEVVPEVIAYNAKGEELQRRGMEETIKRGPKQRTTQVKNEDGSISTTTEFASPYVQVHNCEDDSPEFSGYMSLVFILFALAAVSYTGIYLRSYDPEKQNETTADQNIYRTRNEYQRSSTLEPEVAQGITALLGNSFDLSFALVGSAASATCDASLLQSFEWTGCTYPNPVSGGEPLACSNLLATALYALNDGAGNTDASSCQLTLHFPVGTSYPSFSTLTLSLSADSPSASLFQSLRLGLVQNATSIPLSLPETGTSGSSVDDRNTAAIAGYVWRETLFRRDATVNSPTMLPLASINRRWTITPVAYRTQRTSSWSAVFDSTWYSAVSDVDSPILSTVAPSSFSSSSLSSGSFCPSSHPGLQISISLTVSSSFTVNQTQRFIGDHSVVLTMILGVVAIFQLITFVETLFKIVYHACCYRVHKGLITAAQSTGATGPTANTGGIGQEDDGGRGIAGSFGATAPVPAGSVQRWQVPPDDYSNPNQPMYGAGPSAFGGYPTDAGWAGFEPSLHPLHNPGPGYPPPRVMPLTPSSPLPYLRGPLPPPQQRRGEFVPYSQRTPTRERFDDPRIAAELEMQQRQQRGGFEM